jgi:hypothetical protein
MFVGEVVDASNNPDKQSLALHGGKYWIMNTNAARPSEEERERVKNVVEKFKKGA